MYNHSLCVAKRYLRCLKKYNNLIVGPVCKSESSATPVKFSKRSEDMHMEISFTA
jgi:hypothetical protein